MMENYKKIIEVIMSSNENNIFFHSSGYVEIRDDTANRLFHFLFEDVVDKVDRVLFKNRYYELLILNPDEIEADSIEEFVDGSFNVMGSGKVSGFEDKLMLNIEIKNFKIKSLWLTDLESSTEIPFIENGRLVSSLIKRIYNNNTREVKYNIIYGDYFQNT